MRTAGRHENESASRRLRFARHLSSRSAWRALQYSGFRLYFGGSLASNLGTWFQNTAQVLLAYQLTHSVFAVGVVTCAQFSGSLLLGPWAAVVAGRVGGKRMLIATQLIAATVAAGLAALESAGLLDEDLLIAGALALGLTFTFALPVQTALVPRLVDEAETEAAMAMNSVSYNAGRALAPALCVVVITVTGFTWAFALNSISFVVFAVALARAHPAESRPTEPAGRPTQPARARDGLHVAMRQPRIALLLAVVAAVTFADDPVLVLGPALARHILGISNHWAGYFLSALGLGTVLGSFHPIRRARRLDEARSSQRAARSLIVLVVSMICFISGLSAWVCLLAAFSAGVAALRTGAVTQTQLVRHQPKHTASIMVLWAIAWAGTKPLASLTDGSLASAIGVRWAGVLLTVPALILGFSEIWLPAANKKKIKDWARQHSAKLLPTEPAE